MTTPWRLTPLLLFVSIVLANPCDHQTTTYDAPIIPINVTQQEMTVVPMFSPTNSIEVITQLIDSATTSIDIGTPHFKSWIPCGDSYHDGCDVAVMRNETAPYWAALLNAMHRGVKVRIISNDCKKYPKDGLIDPLAFLALGGADVRVFTTTTFYHAKYICVDGENSAITSINLSESSFIKNREVGVVVDGPILSLFQDTFDLDFKQATPWPTGQFNQTALDIINDPTHIPVPPYPNTTLPCAADPPPSTPITGIMDAAAVTMPDHAYDTLVDSLNDIKKSLSLYIYAINSYEEGDMVAELYKRGINVTLLVSSSTVGDFHWAHQVYDNLTKLGMTVQLTEDNCLSFWHQKVWIIDDDIVFVSTGNWDEHDFPHASIFPPSSSHDWVYANRGFTVSLRHAGVVKVMQGLIDNDYHQGHPWQVGF